MKLFFYAQALILTALLLASCGTSSQKDGQSYSTQRAEVTMSDSGVPHAAVPYTAEPYAALPELAAMPDAATPGSYISNTTENPAIPPLNDKQAVTPERKVAENVLLSNINIGGMTETELDAKLAEIAVKTDIAAANASYDAKTWAIRKEKNGKRLNRDKIIHAALTAGYGQKIQYSYLTVQPEITSADLKSKVKMIGAYTTPFLDRSRSRIKNIRMTSAKLNRRIILPGQEFSFNRMTGSKSKKVGYENATIIVKTPKGPKHKKAPGGGVCQVSTTLYNAVLKGGLKVTERHEHSDDVYYVPDGKDATVTYGGPDFRFVNTRQGPIMLKVYVGRRSLQVKIYENTGL